MVKNPPSNARDAGSILGRGTKIPHAKGQLSPCATTTELTHLNKRAWVPQTTEPTCPGAPHKKETAHRKERSRVPQWRSCILQLRPNAAKKKIFSGWRYTFSAHYICYLPPQTILVIDTLKWKFHKGSNNICLLTYHLSSGNKTCL